MPHSWRWSRVVDSLFTGLLFVWLVSLPLPFGSNIPAAYPLVTLVPCLLCFLVALFRVATSQGRQPVQFSGPYVLVSCGFGLWLGIILLQMVPLPAGIVGWLSPSALEIWKGASGALASAGVSSPHWFPLTIAPGLTALEFYRLLGIFAAFQTGALLLRTNTRRFSLVFVLIASALFQVAYAFREAALGRYAIWGWKNINMYGRSSGTFVNANHFAHYLAILIPMMVLVLAMAWRNASPPGTRPRLRLAALVETRLLLSGVIGLSIGASIAAMLLAQSRGALIALIGGSSAVIAITAGRMGTTRMRAVAIAAGMGGLLLVAVSLLVVFLGADRTVARFIPTAADASNLVGRGIGIAAAAEVWRDFVVIGSGAGSFVDVVSMAQRADLTKIYNHAHNDYLEIAATTGTVGAVIALVTLVGGFVLLLRITTGPAARSIRWRRRAFQLAALASLSVAMVHALFDFNFFIPSNPLTLAVIMGAAVSPLIHDMRTPR